LGASAPAFAQQRVQEENLVYTDPTMAPAGTFLAGIAGEFWGVGSALQYPVNTGTGSQTKTSYVTGYQAGGDIYLGYNNFLVQFEGLAGQSSTTFTAAVPGGTTTYKTSFPSQELDVSLRYAFSNVNWGGLTPYLIVGYDYLRMPVTDTLAGGYTWTATGTPVRYRTYDYNSGYIGVGTLYEFNDKVGLRFDLDVGGSAGSETQSGVVGTATGTGIAAFGHATVYYHFLPEWTVQLGLKAAALTMNNYIEPAGGIGAFLSIGYLHQF
jgi:hypothetical protein